jgi:epoxyqueuosine reductase
MPLKKEADDLREWLHRGNHGTMKWMAQNVDVRNDPSRLLPGCRSIISIAVNYFTPQLHLAFPNFPRISRYAWGSDYHRVVTGILKKLATAISKMCEEEDIDDFEYRIAVDTLPFRDKVWAQRAGIGWIGRHSVLVTREYGSWVFIGSLLTNLDFGDEYDSPHPDHCGNCTACIEACPTGAILQEGGLDARACISYLTIEHPGEIPSQYRESMEGWIFGCDTCQDACPWNRFARPSRHREFNPHDGLLVPDLHSISHIDADEFNRLTRGTPLNRIGREQLRRNALAAMGLL